MATLTKVRALSSYIRPVTGALIVTLLICEAAHAQPVQPTKYATIELGEKEGIFRVAFSPDGERLSYLVSGKRIETWDVKTKKPLEQVYKAEKGKVWFDVAYSPDWKTLAVAEITDVVQIDVRTGRRTVLYNHLGKEKGLWVPWLVRYTPDGKRIVSVDMEGVLKVWDVAKKAEAAEIRCVRKGAVQDVVPIPGTDTAFVCVEESTPNPREPGTDKLLLADLKAANAPPSASRSRSRSRAFLVRRVVLLFLRELLDHRGEVPDGDRAELARSHCE